MHSVAPYTIRCFNPALTDLAFNLRYAMLDKIGTFDAFLLLHEYIEAHTKEFHILEDKKQVFRFTDMKVDLNKREIFGWFQAGSYGIKTDIINVKTGKVDFEKAQNNAEIIRHYVHFYFPTGFNEALSLLHSYRGNGIKTLFFELFNDFFHQRTKLTLQMNPLGYDKAFKQWEEAAAKEIILVKFQGLNNLEDQIKKLGHDEVEVSLKPPKKSTLGKLKDYFNPNSKEAQAIELLSPMCNQIKTIVEINKKRRTFRVGPDASNVICQIDLDDKVSLTEGNPDPIKMNHWCLEIIQEYCDTMYPNIGD
jgi:hypothetical protein